ncbi:MAG: phosphate ABC transporter permease subunit PstC [Spirochaetales bacterium]|nr:MAG: phosphate ABC transporter permease subunit PstC [Spirochaetales bacterium]
MKEAAVSPFFAAAALFSGLILFIILGGLILKSSPLLRTAGLGEMLISSRWQPLQGLFGFLPFIAGTFWVTISAMIIVIPVSILASIYLSEYAGPAVRKVVFPAIDLLAGIPSVVFGACGVIIVVPFIRDILGPAVGVSTSGFSVLAGALVLAVMVFPIVINITLEIFRSIPEEIREASLSLGATKWETVKHVVLRKGAPGIVTAVVLGFARALGETMAVLMVVGNVAKSPASLFDPAYPLPALIANNYGEMMSVPLYDSALMLAALVLLGIVLFFNIIAKLAMGWIKKEMA